MRDKIAPDQTMGHTPWVLLTGKVIEGLRDCDYGSNNGTRRCTKSPEK